MTKMIHNLVLPEMQKTPFLQHGIARAVSGKIAAFAISLYQLTLFLKQSKYENSFLNKALLKSL